MTRNCFENFLQTKIFRLNRAGNSCPVPSSEFHSGVQSASIPEKREFNVLNDEDHSKHILVHSQDVGRKYNGRGSLNR